MATLDIDNWLTKFAEVVYTKLGENPDDIKWLNPTPIEAAETWKNLVSFYYPKWNPSDAFGLVCWERNPILAQSLRLPKYMM